MLKRPVSIVLPLLLAALAAYSCRSGPAPEATVDVWGRWEGSFTASEGDSPDAELAVRFTAPSGGERVVDAFWDGGDVWKARFMPDEPGEWRYRTEGFLDEEGAFVAAPAERTDNPFLHRGAIRVSDNDRHFVHADGTPFLWLGDTAWNGALMSTAEDWQTYLADRREKGFSVIQLVTTQWRAADGNAEGEVAYTGFDEIEINPRFFERIDARMDAVNDAGFLAAPVLLWTLGEPERNPGKLPPDQAIKLADYLVARYGAHHVAWFLAGDEHFGETAERWKTIGRAVFGGREHAPATLHPRGRQWYFDDFAQERWLDFLIYQSSHGGGPETLEWLQTGPPAQKWRQWPTRPILNSEPGYEDHYAHQIDRTHTAGDVRRQLWWSLLNTPIAGVTYGGHGIWSWEAEARQPLNHNRAGVAQPWHVALELPASAQMRHIADFFGSIDWTALRPAPDMVENQSDDPAGYIGASASEAGDLAVAYLPRGGEVRLDASRLADGLAATWFNPRTGASQPAEGNDGAYRAPDRSDWTLLLHSD